MAEVKVDFLRWKRSRKLRFGVGPQTLKMVAPTGVEPVSIASYPLPLSRPSIHEPLQHGWVFVVWTFS